MPQQCLAALPTPTPFSIVPENDSTSKLRVFSSSMYTLSQFGRRNNVPYWSLKCSQSSKLRRDIVRNEHQIEYIGTPLCCRKFCSWWPRWCWGAPSKPLPASLKVCLPDQLQVWTWRSRNPLALRHKVVYRRLACMSAAWKLTGCCKSHRT
jgi:hypothetical protein